MTQYLHWSVVVWFSVALPAGATEGEPVGRLLEKVLPVLDRAAELIDRQSELPSRTFLFGEDKRSNRRKIDQLLDEAVAALDVSSLSAKRDQIRELEQNIRDARKSISEYQRKRISAPRKESLGVVGKANPFTVTQEKYDQKIAEEEENIAAWEQGLEKLRAEFSQELRTVGLELDEEAVEGLLSSVTGDDVVAMAAVFDNVRKLTDQLQMLTEQSGEQLDTAKRYYGMYVVLVEALNHMQERFMDEVYEQHIPALEKFREQAGRNIEQAQRLIQRKGGDEKVLRGNIAANETTRRAAELYIGYLREQSQMVKAENVEVKKTLATAMNTYETVKLSSDLAALMETGRRSFETLMQLRLPPLREFRNEAIRREFQRMTDQLRKD